MDDLDHRATAGRSRFDFLEGHFRPPRAKLISWPGARHTYAFFHDRRRPTKRPKRFVLPVTFTICTLSTCTLNIASTAAFTSGLVASGATLKIACSYLSAMYVPFSDTTGASSTVARRSGLYLMAFIRASPRIARPRRA